MSDRFLEQIETDKNAILRTIEYILEFLKSFFNLIN